MADFRIKFGHSLGNYGNFFSRTDGLIAVADTTPDVSKDALLYTNNTSNTAITYFDGILAGGLTGSEEGKVITLVFLDNSSTIVQGAQVLLADTANRLPANSTMSLIHHNSAWYELCRSSNRNPVVTLAAADSLAGAVFDGDGRRVLLADSLTIRRISQGQQGQLLTIIAHGNSANTLIVNSAAEGALVAASGGITSYTLAGSDTLSFAYANGRWWELGVRTTTAVT